MSSDGVAMCDVPTQTYNMYKHKGVIYCNYHFDVPGSHFLRQTRTPGDIPADGDGNRD